MNLVITRAGSALIQDGVNTFIFELASAMLERGIQVSVLSGCGQVPGIDPKEKARYMFDVDVTPSIMFLKRGMFQSVWEEIACWMTSGSRILHKLEPSMIIMNGVFPSNSNALRVTVCHGFRNQGVYPLAQKCYDFFLYRTVDCVVAVGEPLKKEIELELGFKKVTVIPVGLDVKKYECSAREERNVAILHVGTRPVKNLKTTLRAFELIAREFSEARLFVTGSRSIEESTMDPRISEKVSFLGVVSKQELRQLYSKVMVVSAPSYYEALPYVTLEAFAAGTPVAGSEAIPEQLLVNGFNGCRMSSPDEYIELARRCVELISDPEKWRNLSRNARATALKYDIGRTVSSYMSLARLSRARARPRR